MEDKSELFKKAYNLIRYLFGEKGPLYTYRNRNIDADISKFAKEHSVIHHTKEYLEFIIKHWDEVHEQQVTIYEFPKLEDLPTQSIDREQVLSSDNPVNNKTVINDLPEESASKPLEDSNTQVENKLPTIMNPDSSSYKPGAVPHNPPNSKTPVMPSPKISFSIQNAKVGEDYSAELLIHGETENKQVVIKNIVFPENTGLAPLAPDFRKVMGLPLKDGEHKVQVQYQFQDARPDHPLISGEFNLFINPDPKSLWQKNEPDSNLPYQKKHEDKCFVKTIDDSFMVAASRRGRSHEHSGTFRDDDFLLASEHGWDILAVADGAGSAKSSRKGSELAVQKSMEFLINSLATQSEKIEREAATWFSDQAGSQHSVKSALYEAFGRAAFVAVKAIEEEAASKNANPKDYSTTLLLAGHKKLPIGHFFAAYWVGDGGVGVYEKGKNIQLLGEVDSGEFAGQTRFLDKQVMTPDDVMKRLRFTITDDFTGLVLMTDGVTDPKFETDNNLANLQKWDELWMEFEPKLANKDTASDELLKWLEFWSPGNHDDRTIALLYK